MDPLRPFATLVRSLRSIGRSRSTDKASRTAAAAGSTLVIVPPIESRLRLRLETLPQWHAARAREIFVETVLLGELGTELDRDPEFHPLVQQVSAHLASIPALSSRLDELLQRLSRQTSNDAR